MSCCTVGEETEREENTLCADVQVLAFRNPTAQLRGSRSSSAWSDMWWWGERSIRTRAGGRNGQDSKLTATVAIYRAWSLEHRPHHPAACLIVQSHEHVVGWVGTCGLSVVVNASRSFVPPRRWNRIVKSFNQVFTERRAERISRKNW